MNPQRILGILLLIGGVVAVAAGMNASHSLADQVSNTFYGRFTQGTTWYIIGGGVACLYGLFLVVTGSFGKRA